MDPADNDYWTWREENDRVIQAQAEEQQWYGEEYVEYQRVLAMRDSIDRTFTAMGKLPPTATRRIRLTEAF